MSPSVDFDSSPMWTADGKSIVFVRRPGLPFGQQAQQGGGGHRRARRAGDSSQARQRAAAAAGRRGGRRRSRRRQATAAAVAQMPGLSRATFKGGYTCSLWKADVATGEARRSGTTSRTTRSFDAVANLRLAGDYVVFRFNAGGGRGGGAAGRRRAPRPQPSGPVDEWDRYLLAEPRDAGREARAADDDRRAHRGRDLGGALARRQDALLLHEREGHRAPPHLGGAGRRRHAGRR